MISGVFIKKYSLFSLLILCLGFTSLEDPALSVSNNIVFVGKGHPHNPLDDVLLPRIADSLIKKSSYFKTVRVFSSGEELISCLKTLTKIHGTVGNVAIMGHSGYQGFFVKRESGFYRTPYKTEKYKPEIPLTPDAASIQDLQKAIQKRQIRFSNTSFILLLGCNTAFGPNNIAKDLATVTRIPVIGSAQKLDLYNVSSKGEDLSGEDTGSFVIYYPSNGSVAQKELGMKSATVSELTALAQVYMGK